MEKIKQSIWKFEFLIEDEFEIEMPRYAKILHVQMQERKPCMWALVNVNAPKFTRRFYLRGTGHDCEGLMVDDFIGTFFAVPDGSLIFHLFDGGWKAAYRK